MPYILIIITSRQSGLFRPRVNSSKPLSQVTIQLNFATHQTRTVLKLTRKLLKDSMVLKNGLGSGGS